MIPFLDLGAATRELKGDIDSAVARVIDSGWYVGGPEVTAFEAEWEAYCGAAHCVGIGNGLDALHLALRAVGVLAEGSLPIAEALGNRVLSLPIDPHLSIGDAERVAEAVRSACRS